MKYVIWLIALLFIQADLFATGASAGDENWGRAAAAIIHGDIATVRSLVPSKIAIDAKNPAGRTVFDIAQAAQQKFDAVASYLRGTLNVKAPTKQDMDTLMEWIDNGFLEGIKEMVPSKIKADALLQKRTIVADAEANKKKHDEIVSYLESVPMAKATKLKPSTAAKVPTEQELVDAVKAGREKVIRRAIEAGVQLSTIHDADGNNLLYLLAEGIAKQQNFYREATAKIINQNLSAQERANRLDQIDKNKKGTDDFYVGMLNVLRTCGKQCMKEMYFPTTGGRVFTIIEKELDPKSGIYRELWHELTELSLEEDLAAIDKKPAQEKKE